MTQSRLVTRFLLNATCSCSARLTPWISAPDHLVLDAVRVDDEAGVLRRVDVLDDDLAGLLVHLDVGDDAGLRVRVACRTRCRGR